MSKITFIGAGNMSRAIILGLVQNNYLANNITATRRNLDKIQDLLDLHGINISADNNRAILDAEVIVIGVKPQDMQATCEAIAVSLSHNPHNPIIVSIAVGISTDSLAKWLNYPNCIVRTMPNTPAMRCSGVTGIFAAKIDMLQKNTVDQIFLAVGQTIWVNLESDINIINAISGSGPAYYYYFTEGLIKSGVSMGLDKISATNLAIATALGAAKMMTEVNLPPEILRHNVTSPNGTTQKAIEEFYESKLHDIISQATYVCKVRAEEMSSQFNNIVEENHNELFFTA